MTLTLDLFRPPQPLPYAAGLQLQDRLFERIQTARSEGSAFAGGVILLQHTPTITLGKEAAPGELLATEAALAAQGIDVVRTDRGGKVTVHAPGQWVLYPVIDLHRFGKNVTSHIRKLEEVALRTAAHFGVEGHRIAQVSGAWVKPRHQQAHGAEAKLCAVGISVRKWITRHGLCLNVSAHMPVYQHIIACGQAERGVTSLAAETGSTDEAQLLRASAEELLANFATVFEIEWRPEQPA